MNPDKFDWGKLDFSSIRWALTVTLAILVAGIIGYGLAWPVFYALAAVEAFKPYLPALAELVFTLGSTGLPLVLIYLYFTGRMRFVTGWGSKLPTFFQLHDDLPDFPQNLGLNYRRVGTNWKWIVGLAVAGVAAGYTFDYFMGYLVKVAPQAVSGDMPVAGGGSTESVLSGVSGLNFFISAVVMTIVAALLEEFLFRGVLLNAWRRAFNNEATVFETSSSKWLARFGTVLRKSGPALAILISAVLFALPHLDNIVSQLFFGLMLGTAYVLTRTIWTPVLMHLLSNAVFPMLVLVSYLSGAPSSLIGGNQASMLSDDHDHAALTTTSGKVLDFTQADLEKPNWNPNGNLLMQVCLPAECSSQREILEHLAAHFPKVTVVQAVADKVPVVKDRIDREAAAMSKQDGADTKSSVYPVYYYANNDLHVAPPAVKDEKELTKFVELNYTNYDDDKDGAGNNGKAKGPAAAQGQQAPSPEASDAHNAFVSTKCNPRNDGKFDGKVQYACAYDIIVNTDLSLLDKGTRAKFVSEWEHKFDGSDKLNTEEGTTAAIKSMVAALNEKHSSFWNKEEFKAERQQFSGALVGIGVSLTRLNVNDALINALKSGDKEKFESLMKIGADTPLVIYPEPIKDGPAYKAGLQKGDRFVAVNGKPVIGMTIAEVAKAVQGEEGTIVNLKMARPVVGGLQTIEVKITRDHVKSPDVRLTMLDGDIGVLRLTMFGDDISEEYTMGTYKACTGQDLPEDDKVLGQLTRTYVPETDCKLKGLVIDLRDNPGGRLDQVTQMVQTTLYQGTIVTTQTRNGDGVIDLVDSVTPKFYKRETFVDGKSTRVKTYPRIWRVLPDNLPIVVLINGGSASASELFSYGLQVNGKAIIMGQPSFGKNVGQQISPIDFGAAMRITTFRFLPGGKAFDPAVIPDVVTDIDHAFGNNPLDNPDLTLLKARDTLRNYSSVFNAGLTPDAVKAKAALAARVKAERTSHARPDDEE